MPCILYALRYYIHFHFTNAGVIDEAAEFVKALTANSTLQKEFVEALKGPRGALIQLSQEVRHNNPRAQLYYA